MKEICDRFKQIRKQAGLTQPEYGEKIGLTRVTVNAIENYRQLPTINTLKRIKEVFGVSYNWLIEGK
jgi:transcriptional regulator with XRE-family HTH domain